MAYHFNASVDPRYCPRFEWDGGHWRWPAIYELPRGEHIDPATGPGTGSIVNSHKSLPEIFRQSGFCVHQKFKDAVEGLEPDIHQFIPVTLLRKSGEPFEGQYYLMRVCQFIDAVIKEKSDLETGINENTGNEVWYLRGDPHLTVEAKKIKGRHLWWGDTQLIGAYFCSDELHAIYEEQKMKKVDFYKMDEVVSEEQQETKCLSH